MSDFITHTNWPSDDPRFQKANVLSRDQDRTACRHYRTRSLSDRSESHGENVWPRAATQTPPRGGLYVVVNTGEPVGGQ